MKSILAATSIGLSVFASGCGSLARSEPVVIGGGAKMFYRAGEAVPGVPASENTNGVYLLSADDFNKVLNP